MLQLPLNRYVADRHATPTPELTTEAVDAVRVRATEEPSTLQVGTKQVETENLVAPTPTVEEQAPVP